MRMTETSFENTYLLKYPCMGRLQKLRVFATLGTIVQQVDTQYDDYINLDEPDIHVSFSAGKGYRLTPEECSVLMGVRNPDDRWAIFTNKTWLDEGLKTIKENSEVRVLSSDEKAVVRFRGYLPEKGIGVYYGIEFHSPNEMGNTDGSLGDKRLFTCPPGTGAFVSIDQIRLVKEGPPVPNKPYTKTSHPESSENTSSVKPTISAEYEHLQSPKTSKPNVPSKNGEETISTSARTFKAPAPLTPAKPKEKDDIEQKQEKIGVVTPWKDTPRPAKHSSNATPHLKSFSSSEEKTWFKTVSSYAEKVSPKLVTPHEYKTKGKPFTSYEDRKLGKPVTSYEKKKWVNPATLQVDKAWIKPVAEHEDKRPVKPARPSTTKFSHDDTRETASFGLLNHSRPVSRQSSTASIDSVGLSGLSDHNKRISRQSSVSDIEKEEFRVNEKDIKKLFDGMKKLEERFDSLELLIKTQLEEQNFKIRKLQEQLENPLKQPEEKSPTKLVLKNCGRGNTAEAKASDSINVPRVELSISNSEMQSSALLRSKFEELQKSVHSTVYPIVNTKIATVETTNQDSKNPEKSKESHDATRISGKAMNENLVHQILTTIKDGDTGHQEPNVEAVNISMLQSEALLSSCSEIQKIVEASIENIDNKIEEVLSLNQNAIQETNKVMMEETNIRSHCIEPATAQSKNDDKTPEETGEKLTLTVITAEAEKEKVCSGLIVSPNKPILDVRSKKINGFDSSSSLSKVENVETQKKENEPKLKDELEQPEVYPGSMASSSNLTSEDSIMKTDDNEPNSVQSKTDKKEAEKEEMLLSPKITVKLKQAEVCHGMIVSQNEPIMAGSIPKSNDNVIDGPREIASLDLLGSPNDFLLDNTVNKETVNGTSEAHLTPDGNKSREVVEVPVEELITL